MTLIRTFLLSTSSFLRHLRRVARINAQFPTLVLEKGVVIKGDLRNLQVGGQVLVQNGSILHLGGMPWSQNTGGLVIGADSVISPLCVIYGAGPGGVRIGERFDCGPGVKIFSSRSAIGSEPGDHVFGPVEIGDDVTVFANAVISCGVRIGNGAVVGAGSVVLADVPAGGMVGGSPARILRDLAND